MQVVGETPNASPIARTQVEDDETVTDTILRAARRVHVDLDKKRSRLYDQLDTPALDRLHSHQQSRPDTGEFRIVVTLWNRRFVITSDLVEVYPSVTHP